MSRAKKGRIQTVTATLSFVVRGPTNTYSSVNFGYSATLLVDGSEEDAMLAKTELDALVSSFCRDRFPKAVEELREFVRENDRF